MARALLVGCGCRGRAAGVRLLGSGWAVRGTSRTPEGVAAIEASGIEGAQADPDRLGTITDLIGDVTVLVWLMGSATGAAEEVEAVNGPRLESMLERLVDTPVRGVVLETAGSAPREARAAGEALLRDASARWRIPAVLLDADPADPEAWAASCADAVGAVLGAEPLSG